MTWLKRGRSHGEQGCVIRIDNSFSPFLPLFHSNKPLHAIERASKPLQGHSNWTGIFLSLSSRCTWLKSHQLNAEEHILLGVIVFDKHVKFLLLFSRRLHCSFWLVNLGYSKNFWSLSAWVLDNEGVMLFIPLAIMEPIRGLKLKAHSQ